MKHIRLFEEFETFKRPNLFQRMVKQGKDLVGIENKQHRDILEEVKNSIRNQSTYNMPVLKNVRIIKPGNIVAYVRNKALIVDTETPEIVYAGEVLDVKDVQSEAFDLHDLLMNYYETHKNI